MNCPKCQKEIVPIQTQYGLLNTCCGLRSWGLDSPLVDNQTLFARRYAHQVFDKLWGPQKLKRSEAYRLLALELDLAKDECHMKLMDFETASKVPKAVERIKKCLKISSSKS